MKIKQCSRCREAKSVSEFYLSKTIKDGYSGRCKQCCCYYQLDYTIANKEKINAYQKEYSKTRPKKPTKTKLRELPPVPNGFYQIPNYPNYYVNPDTQQIWSIRYDRMLAIFPLNHGYMACGISNEDGKKLLLFHRILAETCLPNPNNYPDINHLNGVKSDNRLENIEWTTAKKNMEHAILTGLFTPKEYIINRRKKHISKEIALEIRNNPNKLTQKQLAEKFNLSIASISKIHCGRSWKNI